MFSVGLTASVPGLCLHACVCNQMIALLGDHINRAQVHSWWGLGSPQRNRSAVGPLKVGHVGVRDSCVLIRCGLMNLKNNRKATRGRGYEALGHEVGELRWL